MGLITKITDHAAQALSTMSDWTAGLDRLRRLVEIGADQVQLFEDVLDDVLTNSRLSEAGCAGERLDEYGKLFDQLRGNLTDAQYKNLLQVVIAAHQSDGTAKEASNLSSTLIGELVRYIVFPLGFYRLEYEADEPVTGDWQTRALGILDILRPAGVADEIAEGIPGLVKRYDTGPGYGSGAYGRRLDGHTMADLSNLLADGDAEAAGWSAWSTANNPSLSKETGTPDPAEGTRWGKIAYNGTSLPLVYQTVCTAGRWYWLTGSALGDGASGNLLVSDGTGAVWTGATANSWQPINAVWQAPGTTIQIIANVSAAGFAGFDNLRLYEVG